MYLSRLISLFVAGLYVLILLAMCLVGDFGDQSQREIVESFLGLLVWLLLSLACIWYGDEMGEGLIGARCGLISSPSAGWAVKFVGWVLLFLPILLSIIAITSIKPL